MHFEIHIADEQPEAKFLSAMSDPSAYVLDLVRRASQRSSSEQAPNYMGNVAKIRQSSQRFKTAEEVDVYLNELRSEW